MAVYQWLQSASDRQQGARFPLQDPNKDVVRIYGVPREAFADVTGQDDDEGDDGGKGRQGSGQAERDKYIAHACGVCHLCTAS
jgi:hypothetical protein